MAELNIAEIKEYLGANLSARRFEHSLNVAEAAKKLAEINGADPDKAYLSGLLHDICKEIPIEEQAALMKRSDFEISPVEWGAKKTYHAVAGAWFVREKYGITDPDIFNAIRWHTVGKGGMNIYEKIIFMADLISDERDYSGAEELRELTYRDLERGLYEGFKWMIQENLEKRRLIPQSTFDAYNEYTEIEIKRFPDKN